MSIVVTSLNDLDVILCNSGYLSEFLTKEVSDQRESTVKEPANQSESEHITALQDCFIVRSCICKTILHHGCQWTLDDTVWVNTHLTQIVLCLELRFLQVIRTERVSINNDGCLRL